MRHDIEFFQLHVYREGAHGNVGQLPHPERKVKGAIEELSKGKTVIAIAHRLSTVLGADQIIVMEDAEVKATGSHEELLESSALYKRLYQLQYKGEAEIKAIDAADAAEKAASALKDSGPTKGNKGSAGDPKK